MKTRKNRRIVYVAWKAWLIYSFYGNIKEHMVYSTQEKKMNLVGLQFREKNIQKKNLKLETPQFRLKSIDGFYCV